MVTGSKRQWIEWSRMRRIDTLMLHWSTCQSKSRVKTFTWDKTVLPVEILFLHEFEQGWAGRNFNKRSGVTIQQVLQASASDYGCFCCYSPVCWWCQTDIPLLFLDSKIPGLNTLGCDAIRNCWYLWTYCYIRTSAIHASKADHQLLASPRYGHLERINICKRRVATCATSSMCFSNRNWDISVVCN